MKSWFLKILVVVFAPVIALLLRVFEKEDPWDKSDVRVPAHRFGPGSRRAFQWYFEGESLIDVHTFEGVCDFLLQCEYVHDEDLFNDRDFWQHPRTFEHLRKGDCEDHALWAWRKLAQLGIDAHFVSGKVLRGETTGGHCWVHIEQDGSTMVFEATAKSRDRMIRAISEVHSVYQPHFGIDKTLRSFAYAGYFHSISEQLRRDRKDRRERVKRLFTRKLSQDSRPK